MIFVIAFVFGSMIGSFLNVCILRVPKEESIVFPSSHCTSCLKPIAWFDNIPILSFILLRARCRQCGVKISWQYPAVELLTALLFVLFVWHFGLTPKGIIYLIFSLALLVESFIDFRYQIIPDEITLPGIIIGFVLSGIFPVLHDKPTWIRGLIQSGIGILVGGGFLYVLGMVAEWILKKEAMGGGDVKLLAMIGALLGWKGVLFTIFGASFLGTIIGLISRLKTGEERIPFGPFLAFAAFLYLFFGSEIVGHYMRFIGSV